MKNMKKMEQLVKQTNAFLEKENELLALRDSEASQKVGLIHSDALKSKLFISDEIYNFATDESAMRRMEFHNKQRIAYQKILNDMVSKKEKTDLEQSNYDKRHIELTSEFLSLLAEVLK